MENRPKQVRGDDLICNIFYFLYFNSHTILNSPKYQDMVVAQYNYLNHHQEK